MNHDDQLVSTALRTLATELDRELTAFPIPAATTLWFRSERERRRLALARALRPLRVMQILALLCPILIAALLLHQYSGSASQFLSPALLEWGALALILVLTGSLTMLRLARA
jgi:hypothetical protein